MVLGEAGFPAFRATATMSAMRETLTVRMVSKRAKTSYCSPTDVTPIGEAKKSFLRRAI